MNVDQGDNINLKIWLKLNFSLSAWQPVNLMLCTKHRVTYHINSWEWWSHEDKVQWKHFIQITFSFICLSEISLVDVVKLSSAGWKGIQMKVSKNKVWLCDCKVWIENVLVHNLVVVVVCVASMFFRVSLLFILLRVCNAQNVNVFVYLCC